MCKSFANFNFSYPYKNPKFSRVFHGFILQFLFVFQILCLASHYCEGKSYTSTEFPTSFQGFDDTTTDSTITMMTTEPSTTTELGSTTTDDYSSTTNEFSTTNPSTTTIEPDDLPGLALFDPLLIRNLTSEEVKRNIRAAPRPCVEDHHTCITEQGQVDRCCNPQSKCKPIKNKSLYYLTCSPPVGS